MKPDFTILDCPCRGQHLAEVWTYNQPPSGEVDFKFSSTSGYLRQIHRCPICGHFISIHEMDPSDLYAGEYVESTYRDAAGIKEAFDRINALPEDRSDNLSRVRRVVRFCRDYFPDRGQPLEVLDVGSGLCVFLHQLKKKGFLGTALDPDPRTVAHARDVVGVRAVAGDFMKLKDLDQYDLISFNKVLEHVKEPIPMLAKARRHLKKRGLVYVELPDGEAALADGFGREEFFIEHHHIFSPASAAMAAERAGFMVLALERLREPSTKFTIRAFLTPKK